MRKRVLTVAALAAVLMTMGGLNAAWALAPGGPAGQLQAGQIQVGVEGVWTFQERFKDSQETFRFSTGENGVRPTHDMKIKDDRLAMANVAYGLTNWLSLYARLGQAQDGRLYEGLGRNEYQAYLKPVLVWAVGGQAKLWENANGLGLLAGVEYLRYDNRKIGSWRNPDGSSTADNGVSVDGSLDYWRVEANATLYWKLGRFMPYVGAGYTYSEFKENDTWTSSPDDWSTYSFDGKNQDNLGLTAGLAFEVLPNLNLDLRGNFFSRNEALLGITWCF